MFCTNEKNSCVHLNGKDSSRHCHKKNWMRLGIIWNTFTPKYLSQFIFQVFFHCWREYLKLYANFANTLGESCPQILANRAFH